jgi:opacity protein-like surface antigen
MFGSRFRISLLAMIALFGVGAAHAADLAVPPPPPPQPCCDGWYLRTFIGAGINTGSQAQYIHNPAGNPTDFHFDSTSYADQMFIGGGVGYAWNKWLRFEGTAEYRSKSRLYAFGDYTTGCALATGPCLDSYQGNLSSWVFLANAFIDLGTWDCLTPFVGAGIGAAANTMSDFTDINTSTSGFGFGRNSTEWHLAWAAYAGLSYEVSKSFSFDLTYRYLNYGSITDTVDCNGGCNADSFKFGNLHSNDIMLGLRWTCCEIDHPRTVYETPTLRSRG